MGTLTLPERARGATGATGAAVACAHCGLDVPAGRLASARAGAAVTAADGGEFCCAGCETAAAIIRGAGLDAFYAQDGRRAAPVAPSGRSFAEFDHEAFARAHVRTRRDGVAEATLYLQGVHCASCVWLVERLPLVVPGALAAELDVPRGVVRLAWDPARVALSALARALDRLGYRPHPFRGRRADDARRAEERAQLTRIGVAAAIAMNVMAVALALYSGLLGGIEAEFERYFRWVSLALVAPAVLWPGRVFFTSAWAALRARRLHMDVPIALALAAGLAQGAVNTWRDAGPIYFDAVATLILLLLVGRYLQYRAQRTAADSAELLGALTPGTARAVDPVDGAVREVPAEAVVPGMELEVRAGDTLAADGVVLSGASALDLALLTGESRPVPVRAGDGVHAGTLNLGAPLRVRVTEAGETSRLGRLLREVEGMTTRRAPVVLFADRVAGWFIAAALALAATTLLLWWPRDPRLAVDHAIALLVVTCPCALAMATPLAFTVAIGRAAARGILVKGAHALEALTVPGTLFLDKTGTLTEGRLTLVEWEGSEEARLATLALERYSRHPVAAAFHAALHAAFLAADGAADGAADAAADGAAVEALPVAREVRETLGAGIEGIVSGRRVVVGKPDWVRGRIGAPAAVVDEAREGPDASTREEAERPALTPVLVAIDGRIVARAAFGDPVRPAARDAVSALARRGWEVRILSGDDPAVVAHVATQLGLDPTACEGGATPERKRAVVEEARRRGTVAMVGDGVNDAAAISAATVGIAVRGGAEAALAAADVYLARGGIGALAELVAGADGTTTVIRRNMLVALAYNAVAVACAMLGYLDPIVAAVLMPLSSLTAILGAWRGRTFARGAA